MLPSVPPPVLRCIRSRLYSWQTLSAALALALVLVCATAALVVIGATWREHNRNGAVAEPAQTAAGETGVGVADPAGGVGAAPETDGGSPPRPARAGMDPDAPAVGRSASPSGRWAYAAPPATSRWTPSFTRGPLPRVVALPPASALGFGWPLRGVISSLFSDGHPLGIDIAPSDSLGLVLAGRDGVVIVSGGDPCCSYGYFVILDHGDGLTSVYGHLRDGPTLEPGERVVRGTVLGVAGDTGHSLGVHLHFEVRVFGVPVDPELVLTAGQLTPLTPAVREIVSPEDEDAEPGEMDGTDETDAAEMTPTPAAAPAADETPASPDDSQPAASDDLPAMPTAPPTPAPAASPAPAVMPAPTATSTPVATPVPATTPVMTVAPPPLMTAPASPALPQTATAIAPAAPPLPVSTAPVPPSTVTPAPARTSTVLQPPSAPAVLPTTPPNDQAVPDAAPAAAPAIAATREVQNVAPPTEAARPMATPIPRCVTARPGPPAGPSAFIMLNGDEAAARTLVAERCADGPVIVKVRPGDGQVCTAILHDAAGVRLRTLERAPSGAGPAGNAAGEVRWVIAAADLRPNLAVRVTCAAPMERDTGSG